MSQPATTNEADDRPPSSPEPNGGSPQGMGIRYWLAFLSLAITTLSVALDATMLSVSLPTISQELGGGMLEPFWAGTAYLLGEAIFMLFFVSLSNVFGRQVIVIVTLLIFAAGAIICAVSHNWTVMIAGRTVQGTGGGALISLTTVTVTDLAPLRQRGKLYAVVAIVFAVGSNAGPIVGGALAQVGQWRWLFWLNLPIVGLSFVGVAFFLRLQRAEGSLIGKLKEIDYIGLIIFIGAVTSFLMPVTWGGTMYAWSSWRTLFPLLLGIAGLVCFAVYEKFIPSKPLIPVSLFRNYSTSVVLIGSTIHGLVIFCVVYYMPEYMQAVQGYSSLISGVSALPQTIAVMFCASLVGIVAVMLGRYRWAVWAGWFLMTLGCGLLILLDVGTTVPQWIFLNAVSGLGMGLLFTGLSVALQASVPQSEVVIVATLLTFFRSLGQCLGVAVGSSILENRLQDELAEPSRAAVIPEQVRNLGAAILVYLVRNFDKGSAVRDAFESAFANSFKIIWAVTCGLAGAGLLLHLPIKKYELDQEHITDQRFIHTEKRGQSDDASAAEIGRQ